MKDVRIRQYYLYLHEFAIENAMDKYKSQGYDVIREPKIGSFQVDMLAKKNDKVIYFEFKIADNKKNYQYEKKQMLEIKKMIKKINNAEFRVVYITPPKEKSIEIEGIGEIIFDYLINDMPGTLDELSTHTKINDVIDYELIDINVSTENINVKGQCTVDVTLQSGSDKDVICGDGLEFSESFPANFEIKLNKNLEVIEANFEFDLSSWYE